MADELNATVGTAPDGQDVDVLLEPGVYTAELVAVEFKSVLPWISKSGVTTGLQLTFKLLDKGDQKYPWDKINALYEWDKTKPISPKSFLCKCLTAINGTDLPTNLNIGSFVGKKCLVETQNKKSPKSGKIYANIKDVKRLRQGQAEAVGGATDTAPATATAQPATAAPAKAEVKKEEPAKTVTNVKKQDDFDF